MAIKIATWNVNSLRVRLQHVINFLTEQQPDVLALQETKVEDKNFPASVFQELGYHVSFSGQKTYNGMATISKKTMTDIETVLPQFDDPQKRLLATTIDNIRVINIYIPNGAAVDSDKYQYKLQWLNAFIAYAKDQLQRYEKVLICGDFNIAPEDGDVHDPIAWQGHVLVSEPERQAFRELINLGFKDAFRLWQKEAGHYSWWDYRQAAFRRNLGLRIDHILISELLAKNCTECIIDVAPRRLEQPSDHTPVVATFEKIS